MFATIFGLIIFAIPFLLIFCFKNRVNGFLYIFASVLIGHLLIALTTQFFHIFLYPVIISFHSLVAIASLLFIWRKTNKTSFKFKINWLVIVGFLIIFFELLSVHFLYTGTIRTINDQQSVSRSNYSYPLFSDEWSGVAFAKYSINSNSLPTVNPLSLDRKTNNFPNIFICFFSLVAEIFLMIAVSPLSAYVFLSVVASLIICLLIFLLLKANGVNSWISLISTLLIPFAVNGSNLPGLWYLIPFTGGVIFFLLSLLGFSLRKHLFSLLLSAVACLLYPPLFVFIVPTIVAYLITTPELKIYHKIKLSLFGFLVLIIAAIVIIYLQAINANYLFGVLVSSAWRLNLDGGIPAFIIWNIVPIFILPFSIVGLFSVIKNKKIFILTPVTIGLSLWAIYSFKDHYFFIDYARVVVLTSFLLIALAGFGLDELLKIFLNKYPSLFAKSDILIGMSLVVYLFFILSLSYTSHDSWRQLSLKVSNFNYSIDPVAPVNHYLTDDDLELFKTISKKRFLSPPWKGLVLGAATDNYPLESKDSIVAVRFMNYNYFMNSSCEDKVISAQKAKLQYVYSQEFNCDKFAEIGKSSEDLHLYKFNR